MTGLSYSIVSGMKFMLVRLAQLRRALLLLLLLLPALVWGGSVLGIGERALAWVQEHFGVTGRERVDAWSTLTDGLQGVDEPRKIREVNAFFNRVPFLNDDRLWGREDYWATPYEMLGRNGGDCEDFALAKYFTLKALGVPVVRMRITYVKAIRINQAHMVLAYFPVGAAEPLVLDNLVGDILPASQRPDLVPIYSFNAEGLWVARMRGDGVKVGNGSEVNLWTDLNARLRALGHQ